MILTQPDDTHLERPHPPDPNLEFDSLRHALNAVELDTLPPAPPGRLAPEEEQLLRHAHGIAAHLVAADVGPQARKGEAADDGLVGFACTVAPLVVVVEAA